MLFLPAKSLGRRGKVAAALLALVLVALPAARAQDPPATAWQALLAERPEATDDTSISTPERKILQVLTPEQADAYANGRDAAQILLRSGETLAEFIDRTERARAAGLVIRPLEPCTMLDTRKVGKLAAGERRTVRVRGPGTDYSAQGGAAAGCGVPGLVGGALKLNAARAVLLAVEVREAEGTGELALWPSHGPPAPRTGLVAYGPESPATVPSLIVPLCDEESVEPCRDGDLELRLDGAGAHVVLTVHGVLEPAVATIDAADSETAGVPDKSTTAPYWEKRTDNDNLYYTDGFVGIGTSDPQYKLDLKGEVLFSASEDNSWLLRAIRQSHSGYAGGGAHDTTVFSVHTPYEEASGVKSRQGIIFASPEIWGQESSYLYSFGQKNLRLGTVNDHWRRSEIELYNDNTAAGKIFFRTGLWQDPGNVPGIETNVRMMIDENGYVGIGTSAPGELVHIYGGNLRLTNLGGDVELQFLSSSGGGSTKIVKRGQDNALRIRRMDDTDLYYLGQGHFIVYKAKLGLGATTPKSRLDVRSHDGEDVQITMSDNEGSDNTQMGYSNDKNQFAIHRNAAGGQSSFLIKYAASGDLPVFQFDTNTTPEAVVITENGNLKLSGNLVSDGDICIGNCQ